MNLKEINKSIANNELEKAINDVNAFIDEIAALEKEVISFKANLKEDEEKIGLGIIDDADSFLTRNRVRYNLLNTLEELKKTINAFTQSSSVKKYTLKDFKESLILSLGHKYHIKEKITKGESAILYDAEEISSKKPVVIKCISSPDLSDENLIFGENVDKIKRFRHRNIGKILEVCNESYPPSIVMEHIQGYTLKKKIDLLGRPCTFRETKTLFTKLADALHYLHQRNIFDNNLYPDRVFIDEEGEPVLSSLMILTETEKNYSQKEEKEYSVYLNSIKKLKEYLLYLAPEQLRSDSLRGNRRSNQFSLGALVFFMLTGEHLFEDGTMSGIFKKRKRFFTDEEFRQHKLEMLHERNVPEPFIELIAKLLQEKSEDRFENTFEIIERLKKIEVKFPKNFPLLRDSYHRCVVGNKNFGIELYQELIKRSKEAKKRFGKKPDLKEQRIILHNIMNLVMESFPEEEENIQCVCLHQGIHKLTYGYYELFFKILLEKLEQYDFEWGRNKRIKKAWEEKIKDILKVVKNHLEFTSNQNPENHKNEFSKLPT